MRALSSQALPEGAPVAPAVPVPLGVPGVPGVVDVDGSGVKVSEMSVGRDKPGRVGGRVDVTKSGAAVLAVSCETLRQELRLKLMSRSNIQIFFMRGFYLEMIKANQTNPIKVCRGIFHY
jgi:hypothetical protein